MKKLLIAACISIAVIGTAFGGGSSEDKVYELRTSTNTAATSTIGRGLQMFVDLVNEKSDGRIEAVANFGSELGTQAEQVEMAKVGALEMVVAAPGTGPGAYVPELMMFEFPFLFDSNEHYLRVLKGAEGEVSERVEPHGFIARAGQSQGIRFLLTKEPVKNIDDLENMKMRGPNAVYVDMFESLGAAATTMDWSEIYSALQTGVIEGMESAPSSINSMKFHDNAKNLTLSGHIIACVYYFFNADWYNSLPADLQAIVDEAAEEAAAYQTEIDTADHAKALEIMKEEGVTVHEVEDLEKWIEACEPMLNEYRAKGEDWNSFIDTLLSID